MKHVPFPLLAVLALGILTGCKPMAETAFFTGEEYTLTLGVVHRGYVGPSGESHYRFMTAAGGPYSVTISKHDETLELDCPSQGNFNVPFPAPSANLPWGALPGATLIDLNLRTSAETFQIFEIIVN